jgi:hypothetical protein
MRTRSAAQTCEYSHEWRTDHCFPALPLDAPSGCGFLLHAKRGVGKSWHMFGNMFDARSSIKVL